jgi:MIP family channel proteins
VENRSLFGPLIAELIGTFVLVFAVILVVAKYSVPVPSLPPGIVVFPIAVAHVLVLFMLIQTLGGISGGHFNPAVTLALLSIKRITAPVAGGYILVQLVGGLLAAMVAGSVFQGPAEVVNYASTHLADGVSLGSGIALEAIFTFLLVWAIVGTAVNPTGPREWAPAVIAATLGLGVLLIATSTGASLNPARSFGPALWSGEWGPTKDFLLAYVVGPVGGGVIAAQVYNMLYLKTGEVLVEPPAPSEQSPI